MKPSKKQKRQQWKNLCQKKSKQLHVMDESGQIAAIAIVSRGSFARTRVKNIANDSSLPSSLCQSASQ